MIFFLGGIMVNDLNPYASECERLINLVKECRGKVDDAQETLDWYSNFDLQKSILRLDVLTLAIEKNKKQLSALESNYNERKRYCDKLYEDGRFKLFSLMRWFSSERKNIQSLYKKENETLFKIGKVIKEEKKVLISDEREYKNTEADVEYYHTVSETNLRNKLTDLINELEKTNKALHQMQTKKEHIDEVIKEQKDYLFKLIKGRDQIEVELSKAKAFENDLNTARNSYERKIIHEKCDSYFSESKPSKIIQIKKREMDSVNRNIYKLKERIKTLIERASLSIDSIIIDGNNLCYQQSEFIGIEPLKVISDILIKNHKVIIIFDYNIRSLLKMNDSNIRMCFNKDIDLFVSPTKIKADETILDEAEKQSAFIISNDRFKDFPEKKAFQEQRIIRHEIFGGRIKIRDLNINESFTLNS